MKQAQRFVYSLVFSLFCFTTASAGVLVDPGAPSGGDDTATLQNILNQGNIVSLRAGSTYVISSRLNILHDNSGITTASGSPATIQMSLAFNNVDGTDVFSISRANSVGIRAFDVSNVVLENFKIEKVHIDGTWVTAIWLQKVSDSRIERVEMWGFSLGAIVAFDSVNHVCLRGSTIRDSWADGAASFAQPQLTGLVIDDSRAIVGGAPINSEDVTIVDNLFRNLRIKPALFNTPRSVFGSGGSTGNVGYETDGINAQSSPRRVLIVGNVIDTVGEGVDFFGDDSLIQGNEIDNAFSFGIKFVHGAANNTVKENLIGAAGLASIAVAGSSVANADTFGNLVWNNQISEVGQLSAFCGAGADPAFRIYSTCPTTPSASAFWVTYNNGNSADPALTLFFGNTVSATPSDLRMAHLITINGPVDYTRFYGTVFNNASGRSIGNSISGGATNTAIDASADRFALADVDGDGIRDFLISRSANGTSELYRRTSTSSFVFTPNPLPSLMINGSPDSLISGDFNGDQREDLMFHWKGDGTNRMYLGAGGATFTQVLNPITTTSIGGNPNRVTSGDFNGDGRADLMFFWSSPGTNYFAYGTVTGGFDQYLNPIGTPAINGSPNNVLVGDFDGDGKSDLGFHWTEDGTNRFYYGGIAGAFAQALNPIPTIAINGYPDGAFAIDTDFDNRSDVGFMWSASDDVRVFLGQQNRTFIGD